VPGRKVSIYRFSAKQVPKTKMRHNVFYDLLFNLFTFPKIGNSNLLKTFAS